MPRSSTGADMTVRIPENVSTDWSIVTIMGNTIPPRDPNDVDDDDDDVEDEDSDAEAEDDFEPAVIREPDEAGTHLDLLAEINMAARDRTMTGVLFLDVAPLGCWSLYGK